MQYYTYRIESALDTVNVVGIEMPLSLALTLGIAILIGNVIAHKNLDKQTGRIERRLGENIEGAERRLGEKFERAVENAYLKLKMEIEEKRVKG